MLLKAALEATIAILQPVKPLLDAEIARSLAVLTAFAVAAIVESAKLTASDSVVIPVCEVLATLSLWLSIVPLVILEA